MPRLGLENCNAMWATRKRTPSSRMEPNISNSSQRFLSTDSPKALAIEGAVILDLPRVQDSNTARAAAARKYPRSTLASYYNHFSHTLTATHGTNLRQRNGSSRQYSEQLTIMRPRSFSIQTHSSVNSSLMALTRASPWSVLRLMISLWVRLHVDSSCRR